MQRLVDMLSTAEADGHRHSFGSLRDSKQYARSIATTTVFLLHVTGRGKKIAIDVLSVPNIAVPLQNMRQSYMT